MRFASRRLNGVWFGVYVQGPSFDEAVAQALRFLEGSGQDADDFDVQRPQVLPVGEH